jgi:nucleotide-binding universal stress UspA family protein
MFRNILVPVDGSGHAHKAVEVAGDLASKYGARVTVLHVLRSEPIGIGPEKFKALVGAERISAVAEQFLREVAQRFVDQEADFLMKKGLNNVGRTVESGDPASKIVGHARDHMVDLIVMGSRGMTDLKDLMLGSVSHKVAQLAPCTCLTVR